eukprot:CAMPEP_0167781970 /NCGR_PEP_ID=MMETSP0111_2-20121227/6246_1 /TAXON_ID=91324 /ORGANISM="Lotharella globosa, Strain CCCM811" /LENGTH=761 /DNA_ID=CAMNT_0007672727 /DNA_START=79 /DNA_END=2364 /DNA_ORIENTATION=-
MMEENCSITSTSGAPLRNIASSQRTKSDDTLIGDSTASKTAYRIKKERTTKSVHFSAVGPGDELLPSCPMEPEPVMELPHGRPVLDRRRTSCRISRGSRRLSMAVSRPYLHTKRSRLVSLDPKDRHDTKDLPKFVKQFHDVIAEDQEYDRAYLAKFKIDAKDSLSIALLSASDLKSGLVVFSIQCTPLLILLLLVLYLVAHREDGYQGIKTFEEASDFEIATAFITIGMFWLATLLGPATRPYGVVFDLLRISGCCCGGNSDMLKPDGDRDAAIRWRLFVAAFSLFLRSIMQMAVIIISGVVAILSAGNIIGLLWTALALTWLANIDTMFLEEYIYHFHRSSTLTVAVTNLHWASKDLEKEYWKESWISRTQIRNGLLELENPSHIKWNLLTDSHSGLGLGCSAFGTPESLCLSIRLINWKDMDEDDVADLGPIVARATRDDEWIYLMSRTQQRLFFELYPLVASKLEWAGTVNLSHIGFTTQHSAAVAELLLEEMDDNYMIDRMHLNGNHIDSTGAEIIAESLKVNPFLERLWIHDNNIKDRGAVAIAETLKVNKILKSVHLRGNGIGDRGAIALASMLRVNTTLKELGIECNRITKTGAKALVEALEHNDTLHKLWLNRNLPEEKMHALLDEKDTQILKHRVSIGEHTITPVMRQRIHEKLKKMNCSKKRMLELERIWTRVIKQKYNEFAEAHESFQTKKSGRDDRDHSDIKTGLHKYIGEEEEIEQEEIEAILAALFGEEKTPQMRKMNLSKMHSEYH